MLVKVVNSWLSTFKINDPLVNGECLSVIAIAMNVPIFLLPNLQFAILHVVLLFDFFQIEYDA